MSKAKKAKAPLKYNPDEVYCEEELQQDNEYREWQKAKREQDRFP